MRACVHRARLVRERGVVWHAGEEAQRAYSRAIDSLGSSVGQAERVWTRELPLPPPRTRTCTCELPLPPSMHSHVHSVCV